MQLYLKFKDGYGEFQKIVKLLDQQKENLPEGEQPEDGSPEELDFMKDFMSNLNNQADPILRTVIDNIKDTEKSQRRFILNQLNEELKVDEIQKLTKEGLTNKEKLEAWNKLMIEVVREMFFFLYISQIFLSCSYIAFSTTGKQLFEISSGKGKHDSLAELAAKLEAKTKGDKDDETAEDRQAKMKSEYKEKVRFIIVINR